MQLYINVLIRVCNRRLSDDNGLGRTAVDDIVAKLLRAQTRLEETRATRRRSRSLPRSTQGGRRKSRRR